jgi:hypothetical protein
VGVVAAVVTGAVGGMTGGGIDAAAVAGGVAGVAAGLATGAGAVAAGAAVAAWVGATLLGTTGGVAARLGSVTCASDAGRPVALVVPAGAAAGEVSALATSELVTQNAAIAGRNPTRVRTAVFLIIPRSPISACKLDGENGRGWADSDAHDWQSMWLSIDNAVKANVGPDGNSSEQIPAFVAKKPRPTGRGFSIRPQPEVREP